MKNIICFVTLVCGVLAIFAISGCGKGGDEPEKAVPESTATQPVAEQKANKPVEKDVTESQKTEPVNVAKNQPAARETKNDMPAESKNAIPQETESAKVTTAQPAVQDVTDVIAISNQVYAEDKKGPVTLHHTKHLKEYKVPCDKCHHLYKDGRNLWKEGEHVDKCVVCHDPAEDKGKAIKLQNAFHQNCRDCHKEASAEGKKAPYTKCTDCHS